MRSADATAVERPPVALPVLGRRGEPVPLRDWIAVVLAVAAAAATLARFGVDVRAFTLAVFAAVLVILSAIDLEQRRLPNVIVLPAAAGVLAGRIATEPDRALEWVVAAVVGALALALPLVAMPAGMGMGDVKLMLLLGAALGWDVVQATVIAFLLVVPAALWLLARHGRAARRATVPFGPFLAAGALVVLLLSDRIVGG